MSNSAIFGLTDPNKKSMPLPVWGNTRRNTKHLPRNKRVLLRLSDGTWGPSIVDWDIVGTYDLNFSSEGIKEFRELPHSYNTIIVFPTEARKDRVREDIMRILYTIRTYKTNNTIDGELEETLRKYISKMWKKQDLWLSTFSHRELSFVSHDPLIELLKTIKQRWDQTVHDMRWWDELRNQLESCISRIAE